MASYYEEVKKLAAPSEEQILAFVKYVATAHSWYKHLPLVPPGVPFYFFLDPNSGCDLVIAHGKAVYREREVHGFHYSDIPTAEYRRRFGYLQYSARAGTTLVVPGPQGFITITSDRGGVAARVRRHSGESASGAALARIRRWCVRWFRSGHRGVLDNQLEDVLDNLQGEAPSTPTIQSASGQIIGVPGEILRAGRVDLTGVVHPQTSSGYYWRMIADVLRDRDRTHLQWPPETGGPQTLLSILEFAEGKAVEEEQSREVNGSPVIGFSQNIHRLVDPERQRLKKLMEQAIRRMIGLIHNSLPT